MNIPTQDEIQSAYSKAPSYIQDYITGDTLLTTFSAIRETHQLHLDELGNMSRALNAVFLKLHPIDKFPELLKEALEQNSDRYDAVLNDINEKIFKAFRARVTASARGGDSETQNTEQQATTAPISQKTPPQITPKPIVQQTTPQLSKTEDLLEQKTNESAQPVSVELPREDEAQTTPPSLQQTRDVYKGNDPYREPPE